MLDAALAYARRGWHVFPCKPGGREPLRGVLWRDQSTTDERQIREWWEANPEANIGIDCGKSGIVVIDLDEKHDHHGIASWDRLGLPWGAAMARTGTGGLHLYWAGPRSPISNSQGKLDDGIDVRGLGGYVVAPGSTTESRYEWVTEPNGSMPELPSEVISYIQMDMKRGRTAEYSDIHGIGTAPGPSSRESVGTPNLAHGQTTPDERGRRYAKGAIEAIVTTYEQSPAGTGDTALFTACCRIIELLNAPWADVHRHEPWRGLDEARVRRKDRLTREIGPGHGQSAQDMVRVARSARERVGDKQAEYPPDLVMRVGGREIDFTPHRLNDSVPGEDAIETAAAEVDAVTSMLAELLTPRQIIERPPPVALIRDLLDTDSLAYLIGAPGCTKSFVALDWAAHVGEGRDWLGRFPTRQGKTVYVVAEGATGVSLRVKAWEQHHGRPMDGPLFLPRPVQANSPEWAVLTAVCAMVAPALIVLDTQARVTVGIEESSATELGVFIDKAEDLRRATGACVLIVHHTPRQGEHARGSSAMDGAQSSEIRAERLSKWAAQLHTDKQKDMEETEPITYGLQKVMLGRGEDGRELSSLVVTPDAPDTSVEDLLRASDIMTLTKTRIIGVVKDLYPTREGATRNGCRPFIVDDEISRSTYYRAWALMVDSGLLRSVGGSGQSERFEVTPVDERIDD